MAAKPLPIWRHCLRCAGDFCVGAPKGFDMSAYRVKYCPFCGSSDLLVTSQSAAHAEETHA